MTLNTQPIGWARLLAALAVLIFLTGCFTSTPRLNSMRDVLEEELDGPTFDKEFGIKLGRISTSLAKKIAGWALDKGDEEEQAIFETLRGVKRVEVATYETHGDLLVDGPFDFEKTLARRGWQTIARMREDDSFTWVVYKEKNGELRGFMVVALEDAELTLVDLRGRLDQTLAAAMKLARDNDTIASLSPAVESDPPKAPDSIAVPGQMSQAAP